MTHRNLGPAGRIARYFINSKLTPLIMVFSILLGLFAVFMTPREEDPQIVVPLADVYVNFPATRRPRSSNWSPRRWRRSSTRSTASSTSTR